MPSFTGLTEEMCDNAFVIMRAALRAAINVDVTSRCAGTLVVIDPFAIPSSNNPSEVSLEETRAAALYMRRVSENHEDADKYDTIALTKARDMWVLRVFGVKSNRDIQQNFPHLYQPGMTKWHGGTCRSGIPIGFSGVQGNFDEATAETVDAWLTAMCREEMTRPGGVMASPGSFIGTVGEETARQIGRVATQH